MQIWVLIVVALINLSLALLVFTKIKAATATAYFAISALFIVFWTIGTLAMLFGMTIEMVGLGIILFLLAPMATALYMLLFAKHFAGVNYPSGHIATLLFASVMIAVAVYTILNLPGSNTLVAINPGGENSLNFQHPWFMVYSSFFSVTFCLAYIYLIIGFVRRRGKSKAQLLYVALGVFLTSFLALLTNILLPLIGESSLVWLGPTWTVFYVVTTSLSMVKHRLFDVRPALVLTFTYVLSLVTLTIIYYACAFALSTIFFKDQQLSTGTGILDIVLALTLAFLFQPIRNFFDRLTNRIFFRGTYNIDDFVARLGSKLSTTTDLRALLERAASEIAVTLKAQYGLLVVRYGDHFMSEGSKRHSHVPINDVTELDLYVKDHGEDPIITEELNRTDATRRLLVSHDVAVALPLVQADVTIGYLLLGAHRTANYAPRDIKALVTIRDELVIAIQNALSIQEVRELNASLQQRVDDATRELRASNAQLQRLDKAKDDFISMASHQLRTPLTSVKGYISMVREGDAGKITKSQDELLSEAFTSSERMVHLISDFLNVSRLQTGKFLIDKRPVDLSKIVEQELDSLATNAKTRKLTFSYKKPKDFPILNLDEDKMRQVIMNFSDNAIYYSTEGTKITVKLAVEGKDAVFTVTDTGIGVPRAEQSQLFNKFYRASNARKQRPDGTGVGLYLAKTVIEAHEGKVVFQSVEGKGSTFGFRLPLEALRPASDTNNLDDNNNKS